jgi:predicted adenylyl cyclase CyaB
MKKLLVELKARPDDIENVKRNLKKEGAEYFGTFHQTDTYFRVQNGRLKIRVTEGKTTANVIFYERPNVADIKESRILLFQAKPRSKVEEFLSKFFSQDIVVDKIREIYILENTSVFVDQVRDLGTFVELEKVTRGRTSEIKNNKLLLANLCMRLGIRREDFEACSYADLLREKTTLGHLAFDFQ